MAHSALYIRIMNSARWRKLRDQKRAANPLCEECLKEGVYTPTQCIHHLNEIEGGKDERECIERAFTWNNLQSLCFAHHKMAHTGSHKKEAHKQRQADRLAQWIAENT